MTSSAPRLRRPLTPALFAVLGLLAMPCAEPSLCAADDPDAQPPAPVAANPVQAAPEKPVASGDAPAAGDVRKQADAAAQEGRTALKDSDADAHRAVDAAIAFSHALHAYQKLGDTDSVCEMQADIFWCKKKMNLDQVKEYVAKKGKAAQEDFSAAQTVMTQEVDKSEAVAYLDRATKYRDAHPDSHFQNAIFFSEIVDRFGDTDQAKTASKLFDHEQSAYLVSVSQERAKEHQELQNEIAQIRKSRFSEAPAAAVGEQSELPAKDAIVAATDTVKKAYHDAYNHARKDSQKRALARRLATEAEQSRSDAGAYYVMLSESQRLATEAEDYETILTDVEHLAVAFKGVDEKQAKIAAMKKISRATAGSILKLLENPQDKAANLVVGKFYCYNLNRWPDGLPMLSLGSDAELHAVAEMELNNPMTADEFKSTGDAWYTIGKKASGSDRIGAWQRAQKRYYQAIRMLSGVAKTLTQTRLDEMDAALPVAITDWESITPKQWDHLRGSVVTIEARKDRTDTGITLGDNQKVRIVACPTDTWKWNNGGDDFDCFANGNWPESRRRSYSSGSSSAGGGSSSGGSSAGGSSAGGGSSSGSGYGSQSDNYGSYWSSGKFKQGELTVKVGSAGDEDHLGIVTGPGQIYLQPHNTWSMLGTGTLRVKLLPVEDDE